MRKLKNKKRIATTVIAFALIFMVGTAFALQPGTLDIAGRVYVAAPGEVIWYSAIADYCDWHDWDNDFIVPFGGAIDTYQSANISDDGKTIYWSMALIDYEPFDDAFAALTARAVNRSTANAAITGGSIVWQIVDGDGTLISASALEAATEFGLTATINSSAFLNSSLAPDAITGGLIVNVYWDGTVPDGFTVSAGQDFGLAATLAITFDYAIAS